MRDKPALAIIIGMLCAMFLAVAVLCPSSPLSHGLRWFCDLIDVPIPGIPEPGEKPAGDPGEHVVVTGGGTSYWTPSETISPQDTIPVSVIVDIGPDIDTATVIIGADSIPIAIDCEIDGPIYPFRVWGKSAFDGPQVIYGGGASWEPVRLWGASAGPGLAVGHGWFAPVARISRPVYSTIQAGAEAGWRFQRGPDELHVGISVGFSM